LEGGEGKEVKRWVSPEETISRGTPMLLVGERKGNKVVYREINRKGG